MENEYLLVDWIYDPKPTSSIMKKIDMVNTEDRGKGKGALLNQEIEFRWGSKNCTGLIVDSGSKHHLEMKMASKVKPKTQTTATKRKLQAGKLADLSRKKSAISEVLSELNVGNAADNTGNTSHTDELNQLKEEIELKDSIIETQKARIEDLEKENLDLKNAVQGSDEVDIGNGIHLKTEYLLTIKAASGTANIFGRNLLKKLFESDELIGYSLMGKGCNANQTEKLPAIDQRRRDALIGYTLKTFGEQPGSTSFNNARSQLKRSLSQLIVDMNKDARVMLDELANNGAN